MNCVFVMDSKMISDIVCVGMLVLIVLTCVIAGSINNFRSKLKRKRDNRREDKDKEDNNGHQ